MVQSTSQNIFILQNGNTAPIKQNSPFLCGPWPVEASILLSVFVSLTTLILHGSEIIQDLSFCDWLLLLSIMSSGFIHVVCVRISFIIFHCVYIYDIFVYSFICWWTFASAFWLLCIMLSWTWMYKHVLRFCFQFFWINTKKWYYWVTW